MQCPKCDKDLGLGRQIKEWDEMFGEDAMLDGEFPIYINLICDNCEKSVGAVFIESVDNEQEIDSPIVGKVQTNFPKSDEEIKTCKNCFIGEHQQKLVKEEGCDCDCHKAHVKWQSI